LRGRAGKGGFSVEATTMASMAGEITFMCPGWRVWQAGGRWHGRRTEFLGRPGDRRVCHVDAGEVPGLIAVIDAQAELDLAADYPAWVVSRDDLGRWAAALGDETVTGLTAALLHEALGARRAAALS